MCGSCYILMRQGQTTRTDYFIKFIKTVTKICRNRFLRIRHPLYTTANKSSKRFATNKRRQQKNIKSKVSLLRVVTHSKCNRKSFTTNNYSYDYYCIMC